MSVLTREMHFQATPNSGDVSAVFLRPQPARYVLVLGHGAGAGMRHAFMEDMAGALAQQGIATLRYQFPYMEQGRKFPNPLPVLVQTVRSAVATAAGLAGGLPLLAGGKSLGGRMTSTAAAREALPGIHGLVFLGFPLHPPAKPSDERAQHLFHVTVPMLFLQGTRDRLADLSLLRPVCQKLGDRARLQIITDADHSFHVPRRTGKSDADILRELAVAVREWADTLNSGDTLGDQ